MILCLTFWATCAMVYSMMKYDTTNLMINTGPRHIPLVCIGFITGAGLFLLLGASSEVSNCTKGDDD